MKYTHNKYEDGSNSLIMDCEYLVDCREINVCEGEIYISDSLYQTDPYDGNQVSISVGDWEEIKAFVDKQVKEAK